MKKLCYIIALMVGLLLASNAMAQLPANPWKISPTVPAYKSYKKVQTKAQAQPTTAPIYNSGPTEGDILPVDPWANARDRTNTQTWQGSGRNGRLNYTGEATTYTDAKGQEMIAPEANRKNMLMMTQHLRNLGYKIPEEYDQKIRDMPQAYGRLLRENYNKVYQQGDPLGKSFTNIMDNVEDGTGLDFENLLFNSVNILSTN